MSERLNKAKLLSPIRQLLLSFPQGLTRLPYDWCYQSLKKQLEKNYPALWARNSFQSQQLVFLLSDLDLTLITHQPLNQVQQKKLRTLLKRTKRKFPLLGELNIYDQKYFPRMLAFANPIELKRDPELIQFFHLEPKNVSSLQASAFLSQMFLFDRHQLRIEPNIRLKKWKHHFNLVGKPLNLDDLNHSTFLNHFISCFETRYFDPKKTLAFFESLLNEDLENLDSRELLLFYPQWWVSLNITDNDVMEDLESFVLTNEELEIIAEHLNWEIWGLYSQLSLEENTSDYLLHLAKLLTLCSVLKLTDQEAGLLTIQTILLELEESKS